MSYRILYPPVRKLRGRERLHVRLPALTALSFLLFLLLVRFLWPEGAELIRNSVPVSALDYLALKFRNGDTVLTSVSDLLRSLLHDPV